MFKVGAKKAFVLIALLAFFISPLLVLAQDLELDYPNIGGDAPKTVKTGLPAYVKYVFTFFVGIAGLIAFSALVYAGFLYLTSAGNVEKMKEARERIFSALLGITLLFGSYVLLSTINPQLVLFAFPPLGPITPYEPRPVMETSIDKASYISGELPLGQAVTNGVWKKDQTQKTEEILVSFETFLEKGIKVDDPELKNDVLKGIANLNKYLKTVSDRCQCSNIKAICAKPENGAQPVGCTGDPCQFDQDKDIEPDSPRAKINKALGINEAKSKELLAFKEQVDNQRKILKETIRAYQTIENEVISCESQQKELVSLNQYLADRQILAESKIQSIAIPNYYEPRQSNLTFYCSAGGTIFDSSYLSQKMLSEIADPSDVTSEYIGTEKLSCPIELNTGGVFDDLRELAIIQDAKLSHISLLTEDLQRKMQDMEDLISKCNDSECKINCACVPNPCYGCCTPPHCSFCIPFCKSRCIQSVQGCNGKACPTEEIKEKTEEINRIEDLILKEIRYLKTVFPQISKLKITLNNLDVSAGLCPGLASCQSAINSYDKNGQLITSCHPRNFFCCSYSAAPTIPSLAPTPYYIVNAKKFTPLPAKNGCPEGWACDQTVKDYNQYKDASEPLKQLLTCMRVRLDRIEERDELEVSLGVIGAISDINIYKKTCGWETGETEPKGCSFAYNFEYGKQKVSAHYGGLNCRHNRQSYAVDISLTGSQQKEYIQEIIKAAKECSPGAYVIDEFPYLHIDVAQENQCAASE